MTKQRKRYSAEEKVGVLKRDLREGVPVSALCYELGWQPTMVYRWQKQLFEDAAPAKAAETSGVPEGRYHFLESGTGC